MGRPYSEDLRIRLLQAVEGGLSASTAARQFRVSRATAVRWAWLKRKNDQTKALPMGGDRRSSALASHAATILGWIYETPDLTITEIRQKLEQQGVTATHGPVCGLLKRLGLTYKKRQLMLKNKAALT